MSAQQANITGNNQVAASHRVTDTFSSSRSYAPEYQVQTVYTTQRRLCEHLREEARRERTKVSVVCKDLVRYVTDHQSNDVLVVGFQSPKDNPFRDKQQCSLL
ncbi:unnamed protein product [Adineta ricciae]|uniref:G protein gamma domain-containing protein n=1 Tax=Adineta ricciae TaxID=249248 RepID=A0A814G5R2_ADIRI|nr:unnamed protein product [Adineta ricciae]